MDPVTPPVEALPRGSSLRRWALAAAGLACVGLAALGVFVPGLPTTIWLIAASYLFTRSCPHLEQRLIRNRLFSPYVAYLDGERPLPRRTKLITIAIMWTAVTASTVLLFRDPRVATWVAGLPPAAAVIGTVVIARWGRSRVAP